MKAKYVYLLAFVVIALVTVLLTWKYTFRAADTSVASQKPDFELTGSDLVTAYEKDENAANALYLEKILLISGLVESVTSDSLGFSVYLKEKDATAGINCSFDKSALDTSRIRTGQPAKIMGICTGYLMDVVMTKCSLESPMNQ
jgi:hypothetical protein